MQRTLKTLAAAVIAAFLAACGGGGGGSTDDSGNGGGGTTPPVATDNRVLTATAYTYAAGSAEQLAMDKLNEIRLAGGFGALTQAVALDQAAAAHAQYALDNFRLAGGGWDIDQIVGVGPGGTPLGHFERAGQPGFTGVTVQDRALAAGYAGAGVAEAAQIGGGVSPELGIAGAKSVTSLLTSIAHRELMLDPRSRDVGISMLAASVEEDPTYLATSIVYNVGASISTSLPAGWSAVYPLAGSTVDEAFTSPSVHFAPGAALFVTSFTLTDEAGLVVPGALYDTTYSWNAAYKITGTLELGKTYTARFVGTVDGSAATKTWSFTVRDPLAAN